MVVAFEVSCKTVTYTCTAEIAISSPHICLHSIEVVSLGNKFKCCCISFVNILDVFTITSSNTCNLDELTCQFVLELKGKSVVHAVSSPTDLVCMFKSVKAIIAISSCFIILASGYKFVALI